MRKEFLFDAWEGIDDKFIEEARMYEYVRKSINWKRVMTFAAAAVVVVAMGIGVYQMATSSSKPKELDGDPASANPAVVPVDSTHPISTSTSSTPETQDPKDTTISQDTLSSCGGEGTLGTENVCILLSGTENWLNDEEAYAYLMEKYDEIKYSLLASGVNAQNMVISSKGYAHFRTEDNTVPVNWRDFLVYNDGELIAILTVNKGEIPGETGPNYNVAFGGPWFKQYSDFMMAHKGEKLVYLYIGTTEAVITPDNKIYHTGDLSEVEDLKADFDYYSFFDQEANTYTPS